MRWLAALLMLLPTTALCGTFVRYGVGIAESAEYGFGETRLLSLGYEETLIGPFVWQREVGLFLDEADFAGRKKSGFGNLSFGIETDPGYLLLRSLWGVGLITGPDSILGGPFQFNQDLLVGFKGNNGCIIGLDYKHISSADIYSPNLGRNLLLVHVEIPW